MSDRYRDPFTPPISPEREPDDVGQVLSAGVAHGHGRVAVEQHHGHRETYPAWSGYSEEVRGRISPLSALLRGHAHDPPLTTTSPAPHSVDLPTMLLRPSTTALAPLRSTSETRGHGSNHDAMWRLGAGDCAGSLYGVVWRDVMRCDVT